MTEPTWAAFAPTLNSPTWMKRLATLARDLSEVGDGPERLRRIQAAQANYVEASFRPPGTAAKAAALVLADLARQGWGIRTCGTAIEVGRPEKGAKGAEKERIRAQELLKRDEQLRLPTVRAFVERMERPRPFKSENVSITSLMRDGRELAEALAADSQQGGPSTAIQAYLQVVNAGERCDQTGLRLADIWRYFRYTWANQASSTPGRTLRFLVRDAGARFHPVMGIGSLASPVAQLRDRDEWIGWDAKGFLDRLRGLGAQETITWAHAATETALAELYVDDLVEDGILSDQTLRCLPTETESSLRWEARRQSRIHRESPRDDAGQPVADRPGERSAEEHWQQRARTPLFRAKRCSELASIVQARMALRPYLEGEQPTEQADWPATPAVRRALRYLIRREKARRMGTALADLAVCGAVPPYNPLAAGKLVAALAASPEMISAYRDRYRSAQSEIASSMAGRPIVRPSDLVLITTSSLYGVRSSQYNRIRVPCSLLGGNDGDSLKYTHVGTSDTYGTSHFSQETIEQLALNTPVPRAATNVFGAGASPKLRNLRQGLDLLGLPTDMLLQHGRTRHLYVTPLARNASDLLCGFDDRPDYFVEPTATEESTRAIADWWMARWARMRFSNEGVVDNIKAHRVDGPNAHGARVKRPPLSDV